MAKKINIAELLKNCPKGMELYSPIFGKVYLDKIRPHLAIVVTTDKERGDFKEEFLYDGRYGMNGECMLFPSKGKTTWKGFQRPFKDGDVVVTTFGNIAIFSNKIDNKNCNTYCKLSGYNTFIRNNSLACPKRIATEEEKQKLFDAIKENGYKWNEETKNLEKLVEPKFKVGDRIKSVISSSYYTVVDIKNDQYFIKSDTEKYPYQVPFSNEINYKLAPDKFDITTLKPFESRALVRNTEDDFWRPVIFGCCLKDKFAPYYALGDTYWRYGIPYEGNEHLLGTTDDCDEFYKTWK